MPKFISHPLLKEGLVEERGYQVSIAEIAKKESTMVVLPTGLGKTIIALLLILDRLNKGKILFLAPTRPLVEQHSSFLKEVLNIDPSLIKTFTGAIPPERRLFLWKEAKIIVSTPQIIENDLLSNKIDLSDVALVIFDECHRAVGNYSYVYIADKYHRQAKEPLVLGMTASPGSDKERIEEISTCLGIKRIESRTEYDPDVAPYVFKKDLEWRVLEVPEEIKKLKKILEEVLRERIDELREFGLIGRKKKVTKTELLELQGIIQAKLAKQRHSDLYKALSLQAEALKIMHAIELVETQGISALVKYFERLKSEAYSKDGSKAAKRLLKNEKLLEAIRMAYSYKDEHPKLKALKEILKEQIRRNPESRIIVFTNFRDTAEMITSSLEDLQPDIRAVKFIGQASKPDDKGLKQKEQVEIIKKFKEGVYNVLVATSVAEEGLDIPATDLVLFYEPVPSAIRSIQRKGRTGRRKMGRVIVLIAKRTRDEAYYWLSRSKEREMRKRIREMEKTLEVEEVEEKGEEEKEREAVEAKEVEEKGEEVKKEEEKKREQMKITDFLGLEDKIRIFVDYRETKAGVVNFLEKAGVEVILKNLEIGDYVISDKVCVERKRCEDFLNSLLKSRRGLLEQIHNLKNEYEKPLLIIEGESLYGVRNVHPNAIRAVMAAIAIDLGVPIIQTRDEADTASLIYIIAKREQMERREEVNPHGKKPTASLKEQQEYIVSSISNIGIVTAKSLLRRFKTIENIVKASKEELMEVEHVGKIKGERIREILTAEYKE
ncbi:MAG: DEAD/DEAH box helicase [Candidatus Methanospirareceae archaeon]